MASRRKPNLLSNRTATVSIHRNGLSIEIESVPATDAGVVAAALLDAVRDLIAKGYEELVVDAGGVHGGVTDQPEEYDQPDGADPITAKRRMGF